MAQGYFIAIEGADGSGQSTQLELLAGWFRARGQVVHLTKEPSGGPIGLLLRLALTHRLGAPGGASSLPGDTPSTPGDMASTPGDMAFRPLDEATMALLFAADRMDHLACEVAPRLDSGITVLCDRYTLSTYAYQGLAVDDAWLRALNARARVPDLTIYIDVPAEVSVARMSGRGSVERYERLETLRRVRANFLRLVPALQAGGQRIAVVDGTAAIDAVHAAIVDAVTALDAGLI